MSFLFWRNTDFTENSTIPEKEERSDNRSYVSR